MKLVVYLPTDLKEERIGVVNNDKEKKWHEAIFLTDIINRYT